jgi:hypothetical protein
MSKLQYWITYTVATALLVGAAVWSLHAGYPVP